MGNDYPDCYDPIYQAERQEDEWERTLQSCPKCDICGSLICVGDRYCVLTGRGISVTLCGDCIDEVTTEEKVFEEETA